MHRIFDVVNFRFIFNVTQFFNFVTTSGKWLCDNIVAILVVKIRNYLIMVGIPADQNSPKWRSTGNIWNLAYWISDSLFIEIYFIHIYHMSKCNWNRYIEGFGMWNVHFHINGLYTKYHLCYLNELTFNSNLFSLIELLTIFCAVFISYLMVINSKKYKSKYPNTIWWIMSCIMSELWKIKKQYTLNAA